MAEIQRDWQDGSEESGPDRRSFLAGLSASFLGLFAKKLNAASGASVASKESMLLGHTPAGMRVKERIIAPYAEKLLIHVSIPIDRRKERKENDTALVQGFRHILSRPGCAAVTLETMFPSVEQNYRELCASYQAMKAEIASIERALRLHASEGRDERELRRKKQKYEEMIVELEQRCEWVVSVPLLRALSDGKDIRIQSCDRGPQKDLPKGQDPFSVDFVRPFLRQFEQGAERTAIVLGTSPLEWSLAVKERNAQGARYNAYMLEEEVPKP